MYQLISFPTTKRQKNKSKISAALTFGEGFLEAFAVHVSEDVMRLAVEVSEGQLAEELVAGKQTGNTQIRQCITKFKKGKINKGFLACNK